MVALFENYNDLAEVLVQSIKAVTTVENDKSENRARQNYRKCVADNYQVIILKFDSVNFTVHESTRAKHSLN